MTLSPAFNQDVEDIATPAELIYYRHYCKSGTMSEVARELGKHHSTVTKSLRRLELTAIREGLIEPNCDLEMLVENVSMAKQTQKLRDKQRIERKSFREDARLENALSELNKEMVALLKDNQFNKNTSTLLPVKGVKYGMLHLSDLHLNELVNLEHNKYDISIASKRIKKYITESIHRFKDIGVANVLIALTGDLINSDRRLDEKLNQATNRSRALYCAIELINQVVTEVASHFNVWIASVAGNESRVNKDWEWSDICVSDNYDYSIHNALRYLFKSHPRVEFCGDCEIKKVINFGGKNILLVHGTNIGKQPDNALTKLIAQYARNGISIDFIIFGHIHMAFASEFFARSGSPVGANAYSENGLLLSSCASQNRYLINEHGINTEIVNIQNVDGIKGYDLHETLMAYNAKSADKNKSKTTVFSIVI